jgi:hypothetical protein
MPIAALKAASKWIVAPAMVGAALLGAVTIAGPSAGASVLWHVSPTQQSRASGAKAKWTLTISHVNVDAGTIRVNFGDGTPTKDYWLTDVPYNGRLTNAQWYLGHIYHVSCTSHAAHTFTQHWTLLGESGSKTTTVTVTYTGPLCQ